MTAAVALARRAVVAIVDRLPERWGSRLRPRAYRYDPDALPAVTAAPNGSRRVLIGATNYAAQGFHFARALDRIPDTGARNLHLIPASSGFGFPANTSISGDLLRLAAPWRRREFESIVEGFTHVIVESGRPMLGPLFGGDVRREIDAFRSRGLTVAHLAHGSDLRLPSRHREIDEWSPLRVEEWDLVDALERQALAYRELLRSTAAPVFVTTPDLMLDWPGSRWAPLVVDPDRWATAAPALAADRLIVAHAPTNRAIKGTDLIEPTLRALERDGLIEYRRFEGVPADRLPAEFARVDVVLDQFRMGIYSAVSVEGMAAARLVVAHLHEHTIASARALSGLELPIVAASPSTLEQRLRDIAADRARFAELAAAGPAYVRALHDGRVTAEVIDRHLLRSGEQSTHVPPAGV